MADSNHMRREIFTTENYYHIFNRGTDKRQIFMDDEDYLRFLHDMYEFNDEHHAPRWKENKLHLMKGKKPEKEFERRPIVNILAFCLMPNHFHLILKPLVDKGTSLFMKKIGAGYACYFNLKYERSGTLFQGRFKAVHIQTDAQIMHLARYIHILNPGELVESQIREGIIDNPLALKEFLRNFKWSSHLDYLGEKNYSSLINKNLIGGYFKSPQDYEKFMISWKIDDQEEIESLILEK